MASQMPAGVRHSRIPRALMDNRTISDGAKILYLVLDGYGGFPKTFPKVSTLAQSMGRSKRAVQLYRSELEAAGWLEVSVRRHKSNLYLLNRDPSKITEIAFRNRNVLAKRSGAVRLGKQVKMVSPQSRNVIHPQVTNQASPDIDKKTDRLKTTLSMTGKEKTEPSTKGRSPPVPEPAYSPNWGDLTCLAQRLLGNETPERVQAWLIEITEKVGEIDDLLAPEEAFTTSLIAEAMEHQLAESNAAGDADPFNPQESIDRILVWITQYGER